MLSETLILKWQIVTNNPFLKMLLLITITTFSNNNYQISFINEFLSYDYVPFLFLTFNEILSASPNCSHFMLKDRLLLSLCHYYFQLSNTDNLKAPCVCVWVCVVVTGIRLCTMGCNKSYCLQAGDHTDIFIDCTQKICI